MSVSSLIIPRQSGSVAIMNQTIELIRTLAVKNT